MNASLEERFWSKVDKSAGDGCWPWTASRDRNGYGQFGLGGKMRRAHRVAYELATGRPIPAGMQVDHRCRNRPCVRPDHLRLATNKQNQENHRGAQRNSSSGVRGVHWAKRDQRWQGQVKHHGKRIHVGLFDSLAEAEAAAIAKRKELFTHNDSDYADGDAA